MSFTQSIKTCLSKYLVFSGRASRSEYWWFVLFIVLASVAISILDLTLLGTDQENGQGPNSPNSIFHLVIFLPLLAAGWRRLHDTGRPGWYLLAPVAFSVATMIILLTGVAVFSASGEDSEAIRSAAAFIGVTGMIIMYAIQLALSVLMIWWLTRPSQEGTNSYGAQS